MICPSFTFCATAEVAALVGATPVFVDVDAATFNIDANGIAGAIAAAKRAGLTPKAIIPVDLFGLAADHAAVAAAAKAEGLFILDDAAQAFGATFNNRRLGTFGHATATSFFPAKPLGCYGDGGAVMTDDDAMADDAAQPAHARAGQRSIRQRTHRSGLAARHHPGGDPDREAENFPGRDRGAQPHRAPLFRSAGRCRDCPARCRPVRPRSGRNTPFASPAAGRDGLAAALKAEGIPTAIYYPIPLHRQQAYKHYPVGEGGVAVSDRLAGEVISLPMHAYLDEPTQDRIIDATRRALVS